ncbi:MAG: hypothetical protein EXR75_03490 [Myxococcales bacterium]|nr:hypothetical protein [Myxococcales bacterium]
MVKFPWRERARPLYVISVGVFIAALLWIGLGTGKFEGVHRAIMCIAAAVFAYSLMLVAFNTTRLEVEGGMLLITHGPLPWRGPLVVPVAEIARLRCEPHSGRLILRTRIGEEHVIADDLRQEQCARADELIRERLKLGSG